MPIDLPPFVTPPGYECRASGVIAPKRQAILPGITPVLGFAGAGTSPLTSFAYQAHTTGTGSSAAWPSTQAGDLAVFFDCAKDSTDYPTPVTPTGFTLLTQRTDGSVGFFFENRSSFKVCTGSESGNVVGTYGNNLNRKLLVTFRGNLPIASATGGGIQDGDLTAGNPPAITVLAASGAAPLIVLGFYYAQNAINPRTFTVGGSDAKDGEQQASDTLAYMAWRFYNSAPDDVVVDMDDEGNWNIVQGAYIQLTI